MSSAAGNCKSEAVKVSTPLKLPDMSALPFMSKLVPSNSVPVIWPDDVIVPAAVIAPANTALLLSLASIRKALSPAAVEIVTS